MSHTEMKQGTAWSNSPIHAHSAAHYAPSPPPLQLTITGSEDDLRMYLNAPHVQSVIWELDQKCRGFIKHANAPFNEPDEVLEWVREQLAAVLDDATEASRNPNQVDSL